MNRIGFNSLTIRLVLVLLGALGISQAINTAVGASLKRNGFDQLMIAEASDQYALQVVGLVASPGAQLPLATRRPLSGSDKIEISDASLFSTIDVDADLTVETTIQRDLSRAGVTPVGLKAVYIQSDIYDNLQGSAEGRLGGPEPPMVTLIAGRFKGIEGWVNARLRSSPPPPPVSLQDVILDFATVGGIGLLGLVIVISQVRGALRSLRDAAEQVGPSGLLSPIPPQGPDEFYAVFDAFNRMTQRVQELLTEKDVMLGAIGHDLRTPLTSLRLQIEKMQSGERRDKAIETLETTAALLDDILELARSGSVEIPQRPFDIGAITTDVVLDAQDRGQDVDILVHGRVVAPCRPESLRRAIQNLVDNAVKYAGSARLEVEVAGDQVTITIDDDGPGLPVEMLEFIQEPFRRGELSRMRGTGGSGLGLTLARAVLRTHGGSLTLQNLSPNGLRVVSTIPRQSSS